MSTHWNDLKALKDVSDEINPPVEEPYNDDDIEQFKESVQYFIDDFISNNIKLYKDNNFETTMFEAIQDMIYTSYGVEISNASISSEVLLENVRKEVDRLIKKMTL